MALVFCLSPIYVSGPPNNQCGYWYVAISTVNICVVSLVRWSLSFVALQNMSFKHGNKRLMDSDWDFWRPLTWWGTVDGPFLDLAKHWLLVLEAFEYHLVNFVLTSRNTMQKLNWQSTSVLINNFWLIYLRLSQVNRSNP